MDDHFRDLRNLQSLPMSSAIHRKVLSAFLLAYETVEEIVAKKCEFPGTSLTRSSADFALLLVM